MHGLNPCEIGIRFMRLFFLRLLHLLFRLLIR